MRMSMTSLGAAVERTRDRSALYFSLESLLPFERVLSGRPFDGSDGGVDTSGVGKVTACGSGT